MRRIIILFGACLLVFGLNGCADSHESLIVDAIAIADAHQRTDNDPFEATLARLFEESQRRSARADVPMSEVLAAWPARLPSRSPSIRARPTAGSVGSSAAGKRPLRARAS